MTIFITQGNFSVQAMKALIDKPEDRSKAVAALMKSAGAKMLKYYMTTGDYDFLVISEGNSLPDMVAALMAVGSTGTVTNLKTIQAMTSQDAKKSMEKAKAIRAKFRPAGS